MAREDGCHSAKSPISFFYHSFVTWHLDISQLVSLPRHLQSLCEPERQALQSPGLPIVGDHSREEQFVVLLSVLENYNILNELGTIISDNTTTNDILCQLVDNYFAKQRKIWNTSLCYIHYLGHIINLTINIFLFKEVDDSVTPAIEALQKLHNIVVHIHGSTERMKEFEGFAV